MGNKTKNEYFIYYVLVTLLGLIMIYPVIWMFFATFKTNEEIFGSTALLPSNYDLSGYSMVAFTGKYTFSDFETRFC